MHQVVAYRMRFNDLQAAASRVFLRRLAANNDARRRIAAKYDAALAGLPLGRPRRRDAVHHVHHLYVVTTPHREMLMRTDTLVDVILSLPVFPSLTEAEHEHVIASVDSFIAAS